MPSATDADRATLASGRTRHKVLFVIRPEQTLSDERQTLDYAKPPEASGVADGFRLIGGVICVFTALAGMGIIWFGATAFLELPDAPTRDKPYYIFVGSIVCLIGLLAAGFSIRWFINAIRPKRKATIDGGAAGE